MVSHFSPVVTPLCILVLCWILQPATLAAQETPTSPVTSRIQTESNGDIILIHEIIVKAPVAIAWKAYTTTEGWQGWVTPNAKVDLRVGGVIRTNYRKSGKLTDPDAIVNHIINYVPERVLTLQAELSPHFPAVIKERGKHLYNVVTFQSLPNNKTKVMSYGTGYRDTPELQKLLKFFVKANESTLLEYVKYVETGKATPHQTNSTP